MSPAPLAASIAVAICSTRTTVNDPVLWILPHSFILLPFSEKIVPENIWSVWLFFYFVFFKFKLNLYLYGTGSGPRVKKCLLSSDF